MLDEFIRNNLSKLKQCDLDMLSKNPTLPLSLFNDYIDSINNLKWNMKAIAGNPIVTSEYIKEHIDIFEPVADWLSQNPNLTTDIIENLGDFQWFMPALCTNPCVDYQFIMEHLYDIFHNVQLVYNIAHNPNLTIEQYLHYLDNSDNRYNAPIYLSSSRMLTLDFIQEVINNERYMNFNMYELSENSIITEDFVMKYFDGLHIFNRKNNYESREWDINQLCLNPSISTKFACRFIYLKGKIFSKYFNKLVGNPNVDVDFLVQYDDNYKLLNYCYDPSTISSYTKIRSKLFLNKYFVVDHFLAEHKVPFHLYSHYLRCLTLDTLVSEKWCNLSAYDIIYNKNMTIEYIEKYRLFYRWDPHIINLSKIVSKLCSFEYIMDHQDGYIFNDKIIPWNYEVLFDRKWPMSNLTKSSRK